MSEFNDNYPQYELEALHSEEYGKKARRTLWNVFWVMLIITIFELVIGSMAPSHGWSGTLWLKTLFIVLTIAKAAAIVLWFMHLNHEMKFFKYIILIPYIVFMFYTIFIILTEGTYAGSSGKFTRVDPIFIKQQQDLKNGHHSGANHSEEHGAANPSEETHH
jgi:cytochrome c oxidase subunit IV